MEGLFFHRAEVEIDRRFASTFAALETAEADGSTAGDGALAECCEAAAAGAALGVDRGVDLAVVVDGNGSVGAGARPQPFVPALGTVAPDHDQGGDQCAQAEQETHWRLERVGADRCCAVQARRVAGGAQV